MALDPRLRTKIKTVISVKDRGMRQLIKSVFLKEAGFVHCQDVANLKEASESLLKDGKNSTPTVAIIDNGV